MAKYFRLPFGITGDRTAIPDSPPANNAVNYNTGFPPPYEQDPAVNPTTALDVPRRPTNQLFYDITTALQQYQQHGFPDFITSADNNGTAYSYNINDHVRYDNGSGMKVYYSLVDGNTDTPPSAKWGLVAYPSAFVTGDTLPWLFANIRSGGWLWLNGTTIGSAASGATQRANADTSALYSMLWTDYTNAVLPIQDSTGATTTRGASAAADFAANKRLPLPDARGSALFGSDNMGGAAAAGRVTVGSSGISGVTIGASGGADGVALTANQGPAHTHSATVNDPTHTHTETAAGAHTHTVTGASFVSSGGGPGTQILIGTGNPQTISTGINSTTPPANTVNPAATGVTVTNANSGLGAVHQNMPPSLIVSGWIIKI